MTDDTIQKVPVFSLSTMAMAMEEIRRLRHLIELRELSIETLVTEQGLRGLEARIEEMRANEAIAAREADRHISSLQRRITELEAELAMQRGTLAATGAVSGDSQ